MSESTNVIEINRHPCAERDRYCEHGEVEKERSRAYFRFYAELNDHLPPEQQYKTLEKTFFTPSTVKDMIEGFGVPHTEIDLILANGQSVDFSYLVQPGDRIAVYPTFESFDVAPEQRLRPQPLRNPKFILDVHLGRLAAYLRMLGFDAQYARSFTDAELAQISASEHRILLTRDRGLLKHRGVTHGYWVRGTNSRHQIAEVLGRFHLARAIRPFTRCMACNGVLEPILKEHAGKIVPERSLESDTTNSIAASNAAAFIGRGRIMPACVAGWKNWPTSRVRRASRQWSAAAF